MNVVLVHIFSEENNSLAAKLKSPVTEKVKHETKVNKQLNKD